MDSNLRISQSLSEVADLLSLQKANPFRIRAYRDASRRVRELSESVKTIYERSGIDGLTQIPGIGEGLARVIEKLIQTDHLPILDRLRGETDPQPVLSSVPGIGPVLARRLNEELGIHSLEDLELAAYDNRLSNFPGFGKKRIEAVKTALQSRLGRSWAQATQFFDEPTVEELLTIDRMYREQALTGSLPKIAPLRFNPDQKVRLPILHTTLGDRHYTALYSNTARAHELGATDDWVIIYLDGGKLDRAYTVITSTREPLVGRRIVRGRESECIRHYETNASNTKLKAV